MLAIGATVAMLPATAAGDTTASAPADTHMSLSTSAMVVLPQADGDDFAETSMGVRAAFTYPINPVFSAVASFEYVFINEADIVADDTSIAFYSIDAGIRATMPRTGPKPFGELLIGRFTAAVDDDGDSESDSDLGLRLGAGLIYDITASMTAIAQLSYTTVEIEGADLDALAVEGGVGWKF